MMDPDLATRLGQGLQADELPDLLEDPSFLRWMEETKTSYSEPKKATSAQLRKLAATAKRLDYNRQLPEDLLAVLPPGAVHIIQPLMEHQFVDGAPAPTHVRCQVTVWLSETSQPAHLMDIEQKGFDKLLDILPKRKPSRDPDWETTLALYSDLYEQSVRNPPLIAATDGEGTTDMPMGPEVIHGLEPWFIGKETLTLIEHAASSMPSYQLAKDDVFTPTGFVVLERAVFIDTPQFGEAPIRAFMWKPVKTAILCMAFLDLEHELAPRDINTNGYRSRLWPAMHWFWFEGETVDQVLEWSNADEETQRCLLELRKLFAALWLLSTQRVTLVSGQKPVRALRRRAEKLQLPSTVVVVTLRRALHAETEGGEARDVNWSHRWMVSGHWRQRWSDKEQRIIPTWVSPYIKGPEDKPLVIKDRFYRFTR